jgi:L-ascorbate metabolism protein UlaG (beta-lactamase superfamily)
VIAREQPACRFVIPAAERAHALALGLPGSRLITINDGQTIELAPGLLVEAVAAAHEELKVNERGEHHFLGYVLRLGALTLYHSGDAVPYPGLADRLRALRIDAALLPINGRDAFRLSHGVLGNFTFDEAVDLCRVAGIPFMIGHHWGMFDFNTVDPEPVRRWIAARPGGVEVMLPSLESELAFTPRERSGIE